MAEGLVDRILNAVSPLPAVRVSRTEEERRAVYQMRYRVYYEEQNEHRHPHLDHARREIHGPEDDLPETTNFYVGEPPAISASLSMRVWQPGAIPPDIFEKYALDRFPDIHTRVVCFGGYFMVAPEKRGTLAGLATIGGAFRHMLREHRMDLYIGDCAPGLLHAYRRFGARPYGGRIFVNGGGIAVPIAVVVGDVEYFRNAGRYVHWRMKRHAEAGRLPSRPFAGLLPAFIEPGVDTSASGVQGAVDALLARQPSAFLQRLPHKTRSRLLQSAVLLDIDAGVDIMVEGFVERDLFVVMEGSFEVLSNGATLNVVGPGEVLGELAFFAGTGQRSKTVRAATRGRVLHLRHGIVRRVAKKYPEEGLAVYETLAKVMVDRFAAKG